MATKTSKTISKSSSKTIPTHPRKGLLFALAVIPVGIAAWLFLWQFGFIASVVAWGIAAGAVWLYTLGSLDQVNRKVAPYLLAIILLGVILSFLSGMVYDAWLAYSGELGGAEGFFSGEFWAFVSDNFISNAELWSSYLPDLLIALVFGALGAGGTIFSLFKKESTKKSKNRY